MNKRTDTHRPGAINPADYCFVACDYLGGGVAAMDFIGDRQYYREHAERTGGKVAAHHNSGTCHICGARAMYVARYHHVPTNTYITTGMDCAEKMNIGDPVLFASFRKRVKVGLKTMRGKLKAQNTLAEFGLSTAWDIYVAGSGGHREESTVVDVVGKLVQYGSISDGQRKLLVSLLDQIAQRPAREAARAAEAAAAAPVPRTGDARVTVQGVVLMTRAQEGPYGTQLKMLVQHTSGYKLWGTVPQALLDSSEGGLKGATVEFVAALTRSDKDEKFGFFSRPSKAHIVSPAA